MCDPIPGETIKFYEYGIAPEHKLADLLKDNLDVQVNSKHLKLFIQLHWEKIAKLAHKIHEAA